MKAFEQARLVLGAVGTAGFLLAACTSNAAPAAPSPVTNDAPAAQATTMDLKDGAAMAKAETMEPAKAAMESGAMMEKTEGMITDQKESGAMQTEASAPPRKLPDERLSPHFVVSSPRHGETLGKVPERIQINFDFTLHESSAIAVTRDGAPVQIGVIPVNPRGLVLAATLPQAGNGLYVVGYKACWPDRSCHDGQFAFTVGN